MCAGKGRMGQLNAACPVNLCNHVTLISSRASLAKAVAIIDSLAWFLAFLWLQLAVWLELKRQLKLLNCVCDGAKLSGLHSIWLFGGKSSWLNTVADTILWPYKCFLACLGTPYGSLYMCSHLSRIISLKSVSAWPRQSCKLLYFEAESNSPHTIFISCVGHVKISERWLKACVWCHNKIKYRLQHMMAPCWQWVNFPIAGSSAVLMPYTAEEQQ